MREDHDSLKSTVPLACTYPSCECSFQWNGATKRPPTGVCPRTRLLGRMVPRDGGMDPAPATVAAVIAARQSTHGVFTENTKFMQAAKDLMHGTPNWGRMPAHKREALDLIQHKIGRILYGDFDYDDHWVDVEGYANRARDVAP